MIIIIQRINISEEIIKFMAQMVLLTERKKAITKQHDDH